MKTIVIFCRNISADKMPFSDPYRLSSYQDLLLALKQKGVEAYFATDNANYKGDGLFEVAYTTDMKCQVADFKRVDNVRADLVFEKGGFSGTDVMVINPPFVHKIASSKAETFRHFGTYQPYTAICQDEAELQKAFGQIATELVVVKEPEGNGGHLVYIGSRQEVLAQLPGRFPVLAQEFMDTSVGIPGLVEGPHDFRVRIAGGKILGCELRVPAQGEYRANIAQGGTTKFFGPERVPQEVVEISQQIDQYFAAYPRFYAIDFANTPQGWKLIELNSKPGLSPAADGQFEADVIDKLATYLIDVCPQV